VRSGLTSTLYMKCNKPSKPEPKAAHRPRGEGERQPTQKIHLDTHSRMAPRRRRRRELRHVKRPQLPRSRHPHHVSKVLIGTCISQTIAIVHSHTRAAADETQFRPLDPCQALRTSFPGEGAASRLHVAIVVLSSSMNGLPVCKRSSCSAYRHHNDSSYSFSHSSGEVA
jgi:hypothetical protein